MVRIVRTHPLKAFFGLTFLLSWLIWVPLLLAHLSVLSWKVPEGLVLLGQLLGMLGPAASAILVTLLGGGRSATGALLRQVWRWRVRWIWYLAAALAFPVLLLAAAAIYRLLPGEEPLPIIPFAAGNMMVTAIVLTVSALGEEIGWRGSALPRLQRRWTALGASLLLGTLWTAWHLPFWALLDELALFGWGYWALSWAFIVAGAIFVTWLMNNTGNSLLMVLLFHWTYNMLSVGYLPLSSVVPFYLILIALSWAVALGLVAVYGPKQLARPGTVAAFS